MTPPPAAAAAPSVRPARTTAPARKRAPSTPQRTRRPRRVSGPAAQPRRAIELVQDLAPTQLLDRLTSRSFATGRAWIGVVAFALIGIVAMQLWVLKLNAGIGRAVEHEGLLERTNTALSIENSEASSGDRVEQLAATEGMVAAAPGTQKFLSSRGAMDTRLAAAALAHPVKAPIKSAAGETSTGEATGSAPTASSESASGASAPTANTTGAATGTPTESSSTAAASSPSTVSSAGASTPAANVPAATSSPTAAGAGGESQAAPQPVGGQGATSAPSTSSSAPAGAPASTGESGGATAAGGAGVGPRE
jgi:hypothetical protein